MFLEVETDEKMMKMFFSICCPRLTYKCRVILMAELSVMTLRHI